MYKYIRSSTKTETGIFYKNVDICDLPSILSKGILSLNASGNDNWGFGKRVNNSRDVVYLFRPTGYENSFVQYGAALLAVEVDGVENEMVANDRNRGKYIEYVCDIVPPENIKAVYIPEIFKSRVKFRNSKIVWCGMEAKIFSEDLRDTNVQKYGWRDKLGLVHFNDDFRDELNYAECDDDMLERFAQTAEIEDSSVSDYFIGVNPNRTVFGLSYVHYDI